MKKALTTNELLETLEIRFDSIDKKFEANDKRFDSNDKKFIILTEQIQDLTIMTKMGFDDTGKKIDQNTQAISELNHRVTENSDRLSRVEITMNQEFAAATRQRRRVLEKVDNHEDRLCTLES
ncbi:MAG: hypothetical protein HQ488_01265 [Parcubacteria group bacterium]|nr:hypothetical protein [Parcubacteria group bacterium]